MVEYNSKPFIRILVGVLALLILASLLQLVLTGVWLRLLPIVFLSGVLYGVLQKKTWAKKAVRFWAFLLAIGGGLPLALAAPQMNATEIVVRLVLLVVGAAFFWLSDHYIEVDDSAHLDWSGSEEKKPS